MLLHSLKYFLVMLTYFLSASNTSCQVREHVVQEGNIHVLLNFESARRIVDYMKSDSAAPITLTEIQQLDGIRGLITHSYPEDIEAAEAQFRKALNGLRATRTVQNDMFNLNPLINNLPTVSSLLTDIEGDPTLLVMPILQQIQTYMPQDFAFETNIFFIIGGAIPGFVLHGNNLYVALQNFPTEYDSLPAYIGFQLSQMCLNSLHSSREDVLPHNIEQCLLLIDQIVIDGTASLIHEPFALKSRNSFIQQYKQNYKENLLKVKQHFNIFDMIVLQLYNNPLASLPEIHKTYQIGFTNEMESSFSIVGYHIAKIIEKYCGKKILSNLLEESSLAFFEKYLSVCSNEPTDEVIMFNPRILTILAELRQYDY